MKIEEFRFGMYDSPVVSRITVKGESATALRAFAEDGDIVILVQVEGEESENASDIEIPVEIHGTGHHIPNANELKHLGTVMIGGYIWHTFCPVEDQMNNDSEDIKISAIYKYELNKGITEIYERTYSIKPIHFGLQYGRLMLWALVDLDTEWAETSIRIDVSVHPEEENSKKIGNVGFKDGDTLYAHWIDD